jgi:hypothetical protein
MTEAQVRGQNAKRKRQNDGRTRHRSKRKILGTSRLPQSVVAAALPFDLLFSFGGGFAFCALPFDLLFSFGGVLPFAFCALRFDWFFLPGSDFAFCVLRFAF